MIKYFNYHGLPISVSLSDDTVTFKVDGEIITERHHATVDDYDSLVKFCEAVFND